jgi:hypothetical protein
MRRGGIAALMIALAAFFGSAVAYAADGGVTVSATVNGQDVASATTDAPLRLEPNTPANVALEVTNNGSQAVAIKRVEFSGNILGLSFFRYAASTELTVQPGATGKLSYALDLSDLDHQATGLIRGDLKVTDAAGNVVAVVPTVTDVRGSLWSVSGLFGLSLIAFTALALLDVALAVGRNRLPANRFRRGLRFLLPGIGIGLVLAFTAAVLRWWAPSTGTWIAAAAICAAVAFALGYFSPTPGDKDEDELLADLDEMEDFDGDDQLTEDFGYDQATEDLGYDQATADLHEDQATDVVSASHGSHRAYDE